MILLFLEVSSWKLQKIARNLEYGPKGNSYLYNVLGQQFSLLFSFCTTKPSTAFPLYSGYGWLYPLLGGIHNPYRKLIGLQIERQDVNANKHYLRKTRTALPFFRNDYQRRVFKKPLFQRKYPVRPNVTEKSLKKIW